MADERLLDFPSKSSPVPADIIYVGDSADAFNEVQSTIAEIIATYPNLSGIAALTLVANSYPYKNGSSVFAVGSITSVPAASILAAWDINSNFRANNFLAGYATTTTAAGTTTLTVASAGQQFFTGSTTQDVVMPVTSTLALGMSWYIVNNSSGVVTVKSSGANTIIAMAAGTTAIVSCIALTGTAAASWSYDYNQSALSFPVSIANGGTGVSATPTSASASAFAAWDASINIPANNFVPSYATTATAAGTTTLTVASAFEQFFTGATTQTVVLPVTSTLRQGHSFRIVNNSSGALTIQSSGGNTIVTVGANTVTTVTCILTSGTGTASWYYSLVDQNEGGGVTSVGTGTGLTGGTITSTGTISLAAVAAHKLWANVTGGSAVPTEVSTSIFIQQVVVQTVAATGTYTPTTGMVYAIVEIVGGGGGGAGVGDTSGAKACAGGGGAGGGYCRNVYTAAEMGASAAVTIGAAGAGGVGNSGGTTGGDTIFNPAGSGATITASGGLRGNEYAPSTVIQMSSGAAGGAASGAQLNVSGGSGYPGISIGVALSTQVNGGTGGYSAFGSGGRALAASQNGAAASGFGAGGSGAAGLNDASSYNGGTGTIGYCIVTEFIAV
ncbi:hypothetical protein KW791_00115 [Candidatus Parcubacteria bacterium]|nr:hypothetical protein [Candidatus Parcubacteria bacterium]